MLSVLVFSDIILLGLMLLSTVDFKRINAFAPRKHYYTLFFFFLQKLEKHMTVRFAPLTGVCVWMACGWAVWELFHGYSLSAMVSHSFI